MSSVVFFHAHPDDESIATGGHTRHSAAGGNGLVIGVGVEEHN